MKLPLEVECLTYPHDRMVIIPEGSTSPDLEFSVSGLSFEDVRYVELISNMTGRRRGDISDDRVIFSLEHNDTNETGKYKGVLRFTTEEGQRVIAPTTGNIRFWVR